MITDDLIYLVSCAIDESIPDAKRIAGMDMEALYKLASRHHLSAVIAPALKAAGVDNEKFTAAFNSSLLKNATMDMEMAAIFKELDAACIWHLPLKGTLLQHLYPIYGMRQMSDHDILFDAERADDVKNIMEKLGFQTKSFGAGVHDVYYKLPVSNFEMHRSLFGPGQDENPAAYYQDMERRLLGDSYEKHLSPEDFYLYITAHEYKHFSNKGTGLRSLLDIFVYLKCNSLDMDYVTAEAEKMELTEFEAQNRALAQRLFSGAPLTEADQRMLDYILASGVYGTMTHQVENMLTKHRYGKIGYALNRFLVPVSRKNPKYAAFEMTYPFFYRHKIFLPLLPFYRTFRAIKAGRFKTESRALKKVKV